MCPILWHVPIHIPGIAPNGIPIFGFGALLVVAVLLCPRMAARRAQKEGLPPELLLDLAMWLILGGLIGARLTYMIQYRMPLTRFFHVWDGGLVFYGSALGGFLGFLAAYAFILRKINVSSWQLADIIAPSLALGLCLGRIGCLLNGCCYGNIACPTCPSLHFPYSSPPWFSLTHKGHQTAAGFTMKNLAPGVDERTVGAVDAASAAANAGLQPGDVIVQVDGKPTADYEDLLKSMIDEWPRGKTALQLTVRRGDGEVDLEPFEPKTLGLHPTQIYESISTLLIFFLLTAYYPFRRRAGEVMMLFMLCYAVHRFLNEMLRNDTDPVAFGMTLSQNGSILVFGVAVALAWWRRGKAVPNGKQKGTPQPP